ncbi:MAG: substrate-binding domain-containing protein [Gemmatimonadales bacterium]
MTAVNNVVHLPTVLGAVVLTYNLPRRSGTRSSSSTPPRSPTCSSARSPGGTTPGSPQLNPGLKLPKADVLVVPPFRQVGHDVRVRRLPVEGLGRVEEKVGVATSVKWPTGLGGRGNDGVTQQVKQLDGTIGYVERGHALANKLPCIGVQEFGRQVRGSDLDAVSAAAAGAKLTKDTDFRVSITNAAGDGAYPIASFTWLLLKADNPVEAEAKLLRDFANWMVNARGAGHGQGNSATRRCRPRWPPWSRRGSRPPGAGPRRSLMTSIAEPTPEAARDQVPLEDAAWGTACFRPSPHRRDPGGADPARLSRLRGSGSVPGSRSIGTAPRLHHPEGVWDRWPREVQEPSP